MGETQLLTLIQMYLLLLF